VPIGQVAASDIAVGELVWLDDPQAHRVERVTIVDGRVDHDLPPIGLAVAEKRRVTVLFERLSTVWD
jgi:hypothetical protein